MFKVVKECIETPVYLMMCDHRNCARTMTGQMSDDPADKEKERQVQQMFIKSAAAQGWLIGLDAQLCPAHAAVLGKPQEKKLVQVASNADVREVRRIHGAD